MSRTQFTILAAFLLACVNAGKISVNRDLYQERATHPDVGLQVPELVTKYGYPIETYEIETEDHYLITLHRIPHGKDNTTRENKPVVFLMHGLLCSSADWVLMGPEKGLAYLLADLGYDVWMGNARGNTYSRKHVTLNPDKDADFWKFSFHEIGRYDVPAFLDFILAQTKVENVYYIGHSQGTTVFFVMTSELPEYNDKIRAMIALGPAVYMGNVPNYVLRIVAKFYPLIGWVSSMLGQNEFLPSSEFLQMLSSVLCNDESILNDICSNILFLIAGYDKTQLDEAMVPVILSNTPAGMSTRQFLHFCQEINSGKFRQYDYGFIENKKRYGQISPPNYDLSKVDVPITMFYGKNDLLVAIKDVERLIPQLKNVVYEHLIEYEHFSHLDFLWATDVVPLLYNDVIELLGRL